VQAQVQEALAGAVSPHCAAPLVRTAVENEALVPVVRDILSYAPDATLAAITTESIALKAEGVAVGEELLGKRLVDLLNGLAPTAQWFQLGPIIERLVAEGDPRSMQTVETMLSRPDEQARREVVTALAATGSPAVLHLLGTALHDHSDDVATVAARAIAKSGMPGSGALLGARLAELDIDNTDFAFGRELIGALARTPDPAADAALKKLASRRALIKRGHFAEVQNLVGQAQAVRKRGGAS